MKKVFLNLLVIGLLLGGVFQQAQAQDKTLEFNLNIGGVTNTSFVGAHLTLGLGIDSLMGEHIMISPELQVWIDKFRFNGFAVMPGAILNLRFEKFFVGGGMIFPFRISGHGGIQSGQLASKFNIGFRDQRIKLTLYLINTFENFFDEILLGTCIGIVF